MHKLESNKMNFTMNKKMRELLSSDGNKSEKISFNSETIRDILMPNFQRVFDCIVISRNMVTFESEEKFLKTIKEMYTDKTGYEASVTDTLINYYLDDEQLALGALLSLALLIIQVWEKQLRLLFPERKFCFIISGEIETNFVTIRFHQFREEEGIWISGDLEKYDEPIGCVIV